MNARSEAAVHARSGADVIGEALERLLTPARGDESVVFVANGERTLAAIVDRYLASDQLLGIVSKLIEAMYILEVEGGSPTAAKAIARVIERDEVTKPLKTLGARWRSEKSSVHLARALDAADQFSSKTRAKWL